MRNVFIVLVFMCQMLSKFTLSEGNGQSNDHKMGTTDYNLIKIDIAGSSFNDLIREFRKHFFYFQFPLRL